MDNEVNAHLAEIVGLCSQYCAILEQAREMEKKEFIEEVGNLLPKIYWNFCNLAPVSEAMDELYFPEYLEEEQYDSLRMRLITLLGEDDTFLETHQEDMKYSDTPIAASVGEGLADIYQPLYNFVEETRNSRGDTMRDAYISCREAFVAYWSQSLCNIMRPINHIRFNK